MAKERLQQKIELTGVFTGDVKICDGPFGGVSRVWIIEDVDGRRWIAKEHPNWISEQDMDWINQYITSLDRQGFPVSKLIGAQLHTEFGLLGIYDLIKGENFDANNTEHINALGSTLAWMHNLSAGISIGTQRKWPSIAFSSYLSKLDSFNNLLSQKKEDVDAVRHSLNHSLVAWDTAQAFIAKAGIQQRTFPIHGDFHGDNMKFRGKRVVGVFDFDNSRHDFPEADIAKAVRRFGELKSESDYTKTKLFLQSYFQKIGEIQIFPEYVVASLLIDAANEIVYLAAEYLDESSDELERDLDVETDFILRTIRRKLDIRELVKSSSG